MTFIPRAICAKCGRALRPEQNGITVNAYAAHGPYYQIDADLYACPECKVEIIVGFADQPFHFAHDGPFSQYPNHKYVDVHL